MKQIVDDPAPDDITLAIAGAGTPDEVPTDTPAETVETPAETPVETPTEPVEPVTITEAVEAAEPEVTPEVTPEVVETPKDGVAEEAAKLKNEFEGQKNVSAKTRTFFERQRELLDRALAEAAELKRERDELKQKASELPPDVKAKLDEVNELRKAARRVDWQKDERWQGFVQQFVHKEDGLLRFLASSGILTEKGAEIVGKQGVLAFVGRDKDGEFEVTDDGDILDTPEKWWEAKVFSTLDPVKARAARKMFAGLQDAQADAEVLRTEILQDVQVESETETKRQEEARASRAESIKAKVDSIEFMRPLSLDEPGLTEGEKKFRQEWNETVNKAKEQALHLAEIRTPEQQVDAAVAVALASKVQWDNVKLHEAFLDAKKEADELRAQVAKLKAVPTTSQKRTEREPVKPAPKPVIGMDGTDDLEAAIDAAAQRVMSGA